MVRINEHMRTYCKCKQLDHQAAEINVAGYYIAQLFRRLEEIDFPTLAPDLP